jgi:competence protein ComEA
MATELPAERLHRRLGAERDSDTDDDEQPDTSLPRWLPDTESGKSSSWLAAVRAVFTVMRDKPPPVASAKLPPVQMVSSAGPTPGPKADEPVVVSVVGLVHKPGLVTLKPGAGIADALGAAGGSLDRAVAAAAAGGAAVVAGRRRRVRVATCCAVTLVLAWTVSGCRAAMTRSCGER